MSFGLLTEWVQAGLGRTANIGDIKRDIIGALFVLAFFSPVRMALPTIYRRALQLCVLIIISLEILPITKAWADELIARKQFPVLADFETPFEIERWESSSTLTIDREIVRHGKASMKVPLSTAQYSGVALKYSPGDWRNFRILHFSVFNSAPDSLRVTVRVHDDLHVKNGQTYYDRFNTSIMLSHGWNEIEIPIERIAYAPRTRMMNLCCIRGVGIFVIKLPGPMVIYIDNVRLVK